MTNHLGIALTASHRKTPSAQHVVTGVQDWYSGMIAIAECGTRVDVRQVTVSRDQVATLCKRCAHALGWDLGAGFVGVAREPVVGAGTAQEVAAMMPPMTPQQIARAGALAARLDREQALKAVTEVNAGSIAVIMRRMEQLKLAIEALRGERLGDEAVEREYDRVLRALTKAFGLPR